MSALAVYAVIVTAYALIVTPLLTILVVAWHELDDDLDEAVSEFDAMAGFERDFNDRGSR